MDDELDVPADNDERLPAPESRARVRASLAKTPRDSADSFRRSEASLARQVARAVARGQRVL
jgi:hypothetical protein